MSCSELKALIAANGGPDALYGLVFDNTMFVRFRKKNPFRESDLVSIGGVDYLVHESTFTRHSTKKLDVPMKTYYRMECLQQVIFYSNVEDQYDVDFTMYGELK